nr:LemA family protein [Thiomonas sp. FB-Cd]
MQARISGLEESIADRREFYNAAVNANNVRIEQFPDVLVARLFSFNPAVFFKVVDADKADVDLKISSAGQRDTSPLAIRCISNRSIAAVTAMARWLPHDPKALSFCSLRQSSARCSFSGCSAGRRLMEDTPLRASARLHRVMWSSVAGCGCPMRHCTRRSRPHPAPGGGFASSGAKVRGATRLGA